MRGRTFIGIILVLLGAGFLLDKMAIISFSDLLSTYWPIILIIIGIKHLFSKEDSYTSGIVLTLVGAFFLLRNLGLLPTDFWKYFWPAVLILVGILIIFGRSRGGGVPISKADDFNHFVILSGLASRSISKDFRGGKATAILGGIDLDLRDARIVRESAYLELTAAFGGIDLKVPEEWNVVVTGTPILGGWENKTKTPVGTSENIPTLNIKCFAMFGGVGITN